MEPGGVGDSLLLCAAALRLVGPSTVPGSCPIERRGLAWSCIGNSTGRQISTGRCYCNGTYTCTCMYRHPVTIHTSSYTHTHVYMYTYSTHVIGNSTGKQLSTCYHSGTDNTLPTHTCIMYMHTYTYSTHNIHRPFPIYMYKNYTHTHTHPPTRTHSPYHWMARVAFARAWCPISVSCL